MIVSPWPLSELSLWIGYGERLWHDWHFLYQDSVSFLVTDNNVTSSWLISLIYYGLYSLGGLHLAAHFHHLVLLLILGFIYRKTLFKNPWPWPWQERLAIYALWLGSGAYFSLRPALLAFIPFLLAYEILDKKVSGQEAFQKKDWLQLALIQIFWVNLHGSFVLLPVMLAWVLLIKRDFKASTFLGAAAVVGASLINPFGVSIYEYVLKTKEWSLLLGISEWIPATSMTYPLQFACYWLLLVFIIGFLIRNIQKKTSILASPMIPLVLLPLFGLRLSTFAFCAVPFFLLYHGGLFKKRPLRDLKAPAVPPALAFVFILGFTILGSPYFKEPLQSALPPHLQARFDSASIFKISERLRQSRPDCPILNDFNVGGFLMMNLPNPLLMDGRVTPFKKESLQRYLDFMSGKEVASLIQETNPCFAVLSLQTSEALIKRLISEFHFKNLGGENEYILLERDEKIEGSN
jgi:hypothetical protein